MPMCAALFSDRSAAPAILSTLLKRPQSTYCDHKAYPFLALQLDPVLAPPNGHGEGQL